MNFASYLRQQRPEYKRSFIINTQGQRIKRLFTFDSFNQDLSLWSCREGSIEQTQTNQTKEKLIELF